MTQKQKFTLAAFALLILFGWFFPKDHSAPMPAPSQRESQIVSDFFTSEAGIEYGRDLSGRFESRVAHIMAHTKPDHSKPKHSMFRATKREVVLQLLDEAWKKRGPPERQGGSYGRDVYDVKMGRVVGAADETRIRLVMERNTARIITAYPVR